MTNRKERHLKALEALETIELYPGFRYLDAYEAEPSYQSDLKAAIAAKRAWIAGERGEQELKNIRMKLVKKHKYAEPSPYPAPTFWILAVCDGEEFEATVRNALSNQAAACWAMQTRFISLSEIKERQNEIKKFFE